MSWQLRLAEEEDIPALENLIPLSVHGLQAAHYTSEQMNAALGSVFGVDRQLIRDRTYFVAESGGSSSCETDPERRRGAPPSTGSEIIGCGGWSKRKTLFGSDHHATRDDAELDPFHEAARIRAFFIHPDWARRGVARAILLECEEAIRQAGFKRIELASTLPGIPFYEAFGYIASERQEVPLPNGLTLGIVPMGKAL